MTAEAKVQHKAKVSHSSSAQEIEKMGEEFDKFDENIKSMTHDRLNAVPIEETESQTKLSNREMQKKNDIYLKPDRTVADRQKFNEKFRKKWEYDKEYVCFIAEHKEIIGETIEIWTHPYGGVGAEFWKVPTNKAVWGPRYLAEQIKRKTYHRFVMQENVQGVDGMGKYYGSMAVDTAIQRLDARPATTGKSIFMGANNF